VKVSPTFYGDFMTYHRRPVTFILRVIASWNQLQHKSLISSLPVLCRFLFLSPGTLFSISHKISAFHFDICVLPTSIFFATARALFPHVSHLQHAQCVLARNHLGLCFFAVKCRWYDLCWSWFQEAMTRKINVTGPLLKEQALKFASDLKIETF
jgi:hypothetical protein